MSIWYLLKGTSLSNTLFILGYLRLLKKILIGYQSCKLILNLFHFLSLLNFLCIFFKSIYSETLRFIANFLLLRFLIYFLKNKSWIFNFFILILNFFKMTPLIFHEIFKVKIIKYFSLSKFPDWQNSFHFSAPIRIISDNSFDDTAIFNLVGFLHILKINGSLSMILFVSESQPIQKMRNFRIFGPL